MMLKRLVPAMLATVAATTAEAATESELVNHFEAVATLVRNEMRLPAQSQLEAFEQASYEDPGGVYATGLNWYYADTFGLLLGGEAGAQLAERAEALQQELAAMDDLPPAVARIAQFTGRTGRLAERLSREFINPDLPPPLVPVPEERREVRAKLVDQLLSAARDELAGQMAEIQAYEPEVERAYGMENFNDEYWKIIQQATFKRHAYADTLFRAYKPLREILIRAGAEANLEPNQRVYHFSLDTLSAIEGFLNETLGSEEARERLSDWDWNYSQYYPFLKHRLAVLMSEQLRQQRAGGQEASRSGLSYDDVRNAYMAVIDQNVEEIPDRNARAQVEHLKLFAWADLFYWHLAMGDEQSLAQAERLWQEFTDRMDGNRELSLTSRDEVSQIMVGHLYMLRARLALARGDSSTFNRLMAEVRTSGNFFAANAKRWISRPPPSASGQDPWVLPPRATSPSSAIAVAQALRAQAGQLIEREKIDQLYEQAASTLRDAVLGLPAPSPSDADYVRYAPEIYLDLAITLYRRGWYARAAIVCREGLAQLWPELWGEEPSPDNPFFQRGRITESGAAVQQLASYYVSFASSYYGRTRSDAANELFEHALEQQRIFDPAASDDGAVLTQIKLLFGQDEYVRAAELSGELFDDKRAAMNASGDAREKIKLLSEAATAKYYQTMSVYALLAEARREEASQDRIDELQEEFSGHADVLTKLGTYADNPNVPEEFRPPFQRAKQESLRLSVDVLFRGEDYRGVLAILDQEFWSDPPNDAEQVARFLTLMTGSVDRLTKQLSSQAVAQARATGSDPAAVIELINETMAVALAQWSDGRRTYDTYLRLSRAMPALELASQNPRRLLASNFNSLQALLGQLVVPNATAGDDGGAGRARTWLAQAVQVLAGDDGEITAGEWPGGAAVFAELPGVEGETLGGEQLTSDAVLAAFLQAADPQLASAVDLDEDGAISGDELAEPRAARALAEAITEQAKRKFADLFEPILENQLDPDPNQLLSVAQALWDIDEKARAAPLYERYKEQTLNDPALARLLTEPEAVVAEIRPRVAVRRNLEDAWAYPPSADQRGNIADSLIDEPGFLEEFYLNPQKRRADYPEYKADFTRAYRRMQEFREELDASRGLIRGQYDDAVAALEELQGQVRDLADTIAIDTRLIQAYREMGQLDRAVQLARELFEYDPLDPTFMATMVDGVLAQIRTTGNADREQIETARQIAARLRNDSSNRGDFPNMWTAIIQLAELSKALGREGLAFINDRLSSHSRRNNLPSEDLYEPVGPEFEPGSIADGYGVYRRESLGPDGTMAVRWVGVFDRSDMQLIERYLELYAIEGVTVQPPLEIVTVSVDDLAGGTVEIPVVQPVGLQVPAPAAAEEGAGE